MSLPCPLNRAIQENRKTRKKIKHFLSIIAQFADIKSNWQCFYMQYQEDKRFWYSVSGHNCSSPPTVPRIFHAKPHTLTNPYRDHFLNNATEIFTRKSKTFCSFLSYASYKSVFNFSQFKHGPEYLKFKNTIII